jgi:hypothetical protein
VFRLLGWLQRGSCGYVGVEPCVQVVSGSRKFRLLVINADLYARNATQSLWKMSVMGLNICPARCTPSKCLYIPPTPSRAVFGHGSCIPGRPLVLTVPATIEAPKLIRAMSWMVTVMQAPVTGDGLRRHAAKDQRERWQAHCYFALACHTYISKSK